MRKIKSPERLTDEESAELTEVSETAGDLSDTDAGIAVGAGYRNCESIGDTVLQRFYIIIKENRLLYSKEAEDAGDVI